MAANIKLSGSLSTSDPKTDPVLIVGQLRHLKEISYQDVACKLQPCVTEEVMELNLEDFYFSNCISAP